MVSALRYRSWREDKMPELPEVETVVRGLRERLPGRRVLGVRFGKTDFIDEPERIERDLPGLRIRAVKRHGKFIVIELERPSDAGSAGALIVHLGMTGQLVMSDPNAPVAPHTHVLFALDDGRELRYTDIRRFGRMRLAPSDTPEGLDALGADPLEATEAEFSARIRERRARIKALLLDQRVLRGIGNIYADESLWRAQIHPKRLGSSLKEGEIHALYQSVQRILLQAIKRRGSSISDYVGANGETGDFQRFHRAYGREGKRCSRCGELIRRIIVAGRSSHFCPHCQRAKGSSLGSLSNRKRHVQARIR